MPIYWIIFQREYNRSDVIKINSDIYLSIRKEILQKSNKIPAQFKYHKNCSQFDRNDQFSLFFSSARNFNFQMSPSSPLLAGPDYCSPHCWRHQTNRAQTKLSLTALGRHSSLVEQQPDYSSQLTSQPARQAGRAALELLISSRKRREME